MWKWFTRSWYQYLFEDWKGFKTLWCRMRGHPEGMVYYNMSGTEPDYRCRTCRDEL